MKRAFTVMLILLLFGFIATAAIRPANAYISDYEWISPTWRDFFDPVLGFVDVGYVSGETWTLNVWVYNDEYNGTQYVDIRVTRIAVWFDWNMFYNTTLSTTVKALTGYMFTITGTTEQSPTPASNLFTHEYRIYVETERSYQSGGASVTVKETWGPEYGYDFAVLSQDQYDAWFASYGYNSFYSDIWSDVNNYAESNTLLVQAQMEAGQANFAYSQGNFADALTGYQTAIDLLNQSFSVYTSIEKQYDQADLDGFKAESNYMQAQADLLEANASATLMQGEAAKIMASAAGQAAMINAVGFMFFGLGFIIFGFAGIYYARRPKS